MKPEPKDSTNNLDIQIRKHDPWWERWIRLTPPSLLEWPLFVGLIIVRLWAGHEDHVAFYTLQWDDPYWQWLRISLPLLNWSITLWGITLIVRAYRGYQG